MVVVPLKYASIVCIYIISYPFLVFNSPKLFVFCFVFSFFLVFLSDIYKFPIFHFQFLFSFHFPVVLFCFVLICFVFVKQMKSKSYFPFCPHQNELILCCYCYCNIFPNGYIKFFESSFLFVHFLFRYWPLSFLLWHALNSYWVFEHAELSKTLLAVYKSSVLSFLFLRFGSVFLFLFFLWQSNLIKIDLNELVCVYKIWPLPSFLSFSLFRVFP